jgi:CysZ protein
MLTNITRGALTLKKAVTLLKHPDIRWYALIPLIINLVLFASLIGYSFSRLDPIVESLVSWLPDFLNFVRVFLWAIITTSVVIVTFMLFTPVANVIGAPFNAIMSEKIETLMTGQPPVSNAGMGKIIIDSVVSQLGKLTYIIPWAIGLFLISLIPPFNLISPILWIVFGSWLLSLEYLDYPMGNHDIVFRRQRDLVSERRSLSLGFGGAVMILTSIPVVNFFVMPIAVAGSTILWVEHFREDYLAE